LIFLISASQVARITGRSHWHPAVFLNFKDMPETRNLGFAKHCFSPARGERGRQQETAKAGCGRVPQTCRFEQLRILETKMFPEEDQCNSPRL
jgi:hypothetical protein